MSKWRLSVNDPNSWSNPECMLVQHISIEWVVDMEEQVIDAQVIIECSIKEEEAHYLDLDIKELVIKEVYDDSSNEKLEYDLGEPVDEFGCRLRIHLPNDHPTVCKIKIKYLVPKSATALQWLLPEQTSGKLYPFMFSQCQAIHARSLLPCQDTPSVKFTYCAEVTVPKHLTVLMSALKTGIEEDTENKKKFKFHQPMVIPSYLLAIAVGKLASRKVGPRSTVWAEEEVIEIAKNEFSQTEEFLQTAEWFCGPYEWGVYDLLVLPPSFPFGGMENPCLTFVTPTVLAGDKSLVDVVAHEISHSWMGNLVTNNTFEHFWLNEGFTVFIERKIFGHIYGENTRHFLSLCGLADLKISVDDLGHDNHITSLVPNLEGINPDDSFSICPYEKGYTFLFYLETLIGDTELFNKFLKDYIKKFRKLSISTLDFKKFFEEYFQEKSETLKQINWERWLYSTGMPPITPKYNTELLAAVQALAKQWIEWDIKTDPCFSTVELKSFSTKQIEAFLTILLNEKDYPLYKLEKMRTIYEMDNISNAEIAFRWLRLCIRNHWKDQIQPCFKFLNKLGRMKYLRPLYRELISWEEIRAAVIKNFEENKKGMMHVTAYTVSKDLGLN